MQEGSLVSLESWSVCIAQTFHRHKHLQVLTQTLGLAQDDSENTCVEAEASPKRLVPLSLCLCHQLNCQALQARNYALLGQKLNVHQENSPLMCKAHSDLLALLLSIRKLLTRRLCETLWPSHPLLHFHWQEVEGLTPEPTFLFSGSRMIAALTSVTLASLRRPGWVSQHC